MVSSRTRDSSEVDQQTTTSKPRRPRNTAEVRRALLAWAADYLRDYPWRKRSVSNYEVLVAEVLLKRTTARAAARTYVSFIAQFPDLASITEAPIEEVEQALTPVGLYRQRAKGLKEMAKYLAREHGGQVPNNLTALVRVPHLGPYTARAVLSFGHGRPAAVVDSNVQRVLGRLYKRRLGQAPSLSDVQALADGLLPPGSHQTFNWALLDLGATVCRYDMPRCLVCPLARLCDYSKHHVRAKEGRATRIRSREGR